MKDLPLSPTTGPVHDAGVMPAAVPPVAVKASPEAAPLRGLGQDAVSQVPAPAADFEAVQPATNFEGRVPAMPAPAAPPTGLQAMTDAPADQHAITRMLQELGSQGQSAFLQLPSDQQAQFGQVWADVGRLEHGPLPDGVTREQLLAIADGEAGSSATEVRAQLAQALVSGRLTQAGAGGQTALAALDGLRTVSLTLPPGAADPIYRQQLLHGLIGEIADPMSIRQGNYNTCGATCAQRLFVRTDPGGYAAFVVDLASEAGRGTLPDGSVVRRQPDSLVAHQPSDSRQRDNRNPIERMVQAAFMDHATPLDYRNARDSNTVLGIPIAPGMYGRGIAELYSAIRNRTVEVLPSDSMLTFLDGGHMTGVSQPTLMAGLERQLQRHADETVPVEVHWNDRGRGAGNLHWIDVRQATDDRVYFLNPHGNSFGLLRGQTLEALPVDAGNGLRYIEVEGSGSAPARRIYEDGTESVERRWFERSVEEAMVDPDILAAALASEPPVIASF